MTLYRIVNPDAGTFGPLSEEEVIRLIQQGEVALDAMVTGDSGPSVPITKIPAFAEAFENRMGVGAGGPMVSDSTPQSSRALTSPSLDDLTESVLEEGAISDDEVPTPLSLGAPDTTAPIPEDTKDLKPKQNAVEPDFKDTSRTVRSLKDIRNLFRFPWA